VSFDLLAGLPPNITLSVSEQIVSGVVLIVQKHRDITRYRGAFKQVNIADTSAHRSQTEWNLVFALVRSTITHSEAARLSFEFLSSLVADGPEQHVTADNFSALVTLLDDFATHAGLAVEAQQAKSRRHEALTSGKYVACISRHVR
jgi:golgi-specific brefeldin A-resistance guanine nucleotide exchange factor 1